LLLVDFVPLTGFILEVLNHPTEQIAFAGTPHVDCQHEMVIGFLLFNNRRLMGENRNEVLPGTLNLLILKTLAGLGPLHGYGIARRIEQVSGDLLQLNQGQSTRRC